MDKCPYCGSGDGLFSKELTRYEQYYKFDGEPDGYSEFDNIVRRKSTPLYCICCGKRVTTLEKIGEHRPPEGETDA